MNEIPKPLLDFIFSFLGNLKQFSSLQCINKQIREIINQGNLFLNVICQEQKAFRWWSQRLRRVKIIYILDHSSIPLIDTISHYRDSFAYLKHITLDFSLLVHVEKQFPSILNNCPSLILRLNESDPQKFWLKSNHEEFLKNIKALETITRATNHQEWRPRRKRIIASEFIHLNLHFFLECDLHDIHMQRLKFLFLELCSPFKQKKLLKILNDFDCVRTCFFLFELNINFQFLDKEYQELTKHIFVDCFKRMIQTTWTTLQKEEKNTNINIHTFHYQQTKSIKTSLVGFFGKISYSFKIEMISCLFAKLSSLSYLGGSYFFFFLIEIDNGNTLKSILQDVFPKKPCKYAKMGCLFGPCCSEGFISTMTTIRDWLLASSWMFKTMLERCLSNFLLSLSTGLEEKRKKNHL